MKRDMDLIREILLVTESDGAHKSKKDYPEEQIAYHVQLLIKEGLLEGKAVPSVNRGGRQTPSAYVITRMTMEGHDFLDLARKNKIWEKAKSTLKEKGAEWTIDMLKFALIQAAKSHLHLPE